jgi:hypothetical protein
MMTRYTQNLNSLRVLLALLLAALSLSSIFSQDIELPEEPGLTCIEGIDLNLRTEGSQQGSLLLLELRMDEPMQDLRAVFGGQQVHFWQEGGREDVLLGFLGLDLGLPVGPLPLTLTARNAGGALVSCSALINVQDAQFAEDHLKVSNRFVEVKPKNRERTKREAERLRKIFATVSPEPLWGGSFQPPLKVMKPSGNFGRRRFFNGEPRSPHTGEDLTANLGTPIYAPQGGRVVLAENLFFAGNAVILDHGLGLFTFFAHMSSIKVKKGSTVIAGEVLGLVGATGRVTGAHLHWSARQGKARINPLKLLTLPLGTKTNNERASTPSSREK